MTLQTSQILNNRYRIVKLLGQGGFGAVYRAWDVNFDLPCAVKENFETSPEAQRQFVREAQLLHSLRHPNLPLVKDYFVIPDQGQYLVMDYVDGEDLEAILKRSPGPLPEARVVEWLASICDALTYLHTHQPPVIHRDIKPANIKIAPLINETGSVQDVLRLPLEETRAYLVDFGISKVYDPESRTTLGARAVTPGYSPFEQYGQAPTDARTDIYALGATAYSLLTNQLPTESISRMSGEELPAPRTFNPSLSPEVEAAILRALEMMPENRYPSAVDFRCALKSSVSAPVQSKTDYGTMLVTPPTVQHTPSTQIASMQSISTSGITDLQQPDRKRTIWRWILLLGLLGLAIGVAIALLNQPSFISAWVYPPTNTVQELPVEPPPEMAPTERTVEEPVEPPPEPTQRMPEQPVEQPPEFGPLAGEWRGSIHELAEERINFEAMLFIEQPAGSESFGGGMEVRFPDGHVEGREILEGILVGREFRFRDNTDLHYWGMLETDFRIVGQAAWGCFDCPPWAEFEFNR